MMTIAIRRFRSGRERARRGERGRRAWKVSAGCAPRIRGGFNWREKQTRDQLERTALRRPVSAGFVFFMAKLAIGRSRPIKSHVCSLCGGARTHTPPGEADFTRCTTIIFNDERKSPVLTRRRNFSLLVLDDRPKSCHFPR